MTLKEIIIDKFLANEKGTTYYTVYQTYRQELERMYDEVYGCIKNGEDFKRFLNFKGATTADGRIRHDRLSDYIDPEDKKKTVQKVEIVFRYPVYSYFYSKIKDGLAAIKEKEKSIPLPN